MMGYGWLFAAMLLLALGGGALYARKKIRGFSNTIFGVKSLVRGLELQADQLAQTPKSVSGMTKVYLPQIERDFSQFSFEEFRQKAENMLISAFQAIGAQDETRLVNASESLRDQVRLQIADYKERGARAVYERMKVHRTEITRYERASGCCTITLQSALEYLHYIEENGQTRGDAGRLTQTKYNVELLYIQDVQKARAVKGDRAVGLSCPNCGAPITGIGRKSCEYCGSGIVEINLHAWALDRFYEV